MRRVAVAFFITVFILCMFQIVPPAQGSELPEDRAKIAFVTTSERYISLIKSAGDGEDMNISNLVNVMAYHVSTRDSDTYENINLSNQDVIMLVHLGYPIQDAIKDTVAKAKDNGAYVITYQFEDVYNLGNVNLSDPSYSNITRYWNYGGEENIKRLITFLGVKFCNVNMEIPSPIPVPLHGLYHPDAPGFGVFETTSEYLEWYNATGKYNASNPTIGIHYYYTPRTKYGFHAIVDPLIRAFESKGANVIFATFTHRDPNSTRYFIQDNKSIVDSVVTLTSFRLYYGEEEKGIKYLKNLNVTPLKGIASYYSSPEEWKNSTGLTPSETAWQIALPELDGLTEFIYLGGKKKDPVSGLKRYEPVDYQIDWITDRALAWAKLKRKANPEKKIAIIYYNHGGGKDNFGASYLNVPRSLNVLLKAMQREGYYLGEKEAPNETELIELMQKQGRNIGTWSPGELDEMVREGKVVLLPEEKYLSWFRELPLDKRKEVIHKWGEPPGDIMVWKNETENRNYIVIPRIKLGNVILAPQPTRGRLQNNSALYHDKELPPHHQYIAFYLWLKREYGADAIVHFGKHGTQEWLPGKETALSAKSCWPAILIQDLPVVYPYIVDDVGEGTQAKRRGQAVIVDHLTSPIVKSELYANLSKLSDKIDRYEMTEEARLKEEYKKTIIKLYEEEGLEEALNVSSEELRKMEEKEFAEFLDKLHEYLEEIKHELMPYGMHTLGKTPEGKRLVGFIDSMLGKEFEDNIFEFIGEENETMGLKLLNLTILEGKEPVVAQKEVLGKISPNITRDLELSMKYAEDIKGCSIEIPRIIKALNAGYIPPSVGNDPVRTPGAIPTGKNFHFADPRTIPTKEAFELGKKAGEQLIEEYKKKKGEYPKKLAFVLWATETMRNQGVVESEILYLMGAKPVWDSKGRVKGVELIDSEELGRPRIDVVVTTSGVYRDTFPNKIKLIDEAVRLAAAAEEEENYVAINSKAIASNLKESYNKSIAKNLSKARIFAEPLGAYGTNLPPQIFASNTWENENKLAGHYINRMSHIYGKEVWGEHARGVFEENLRNVNIAVHSQSSNQYGVLDNDDYFQYLGGLTLGVRHVKGESPYTYITDLRISGEVKTTELEHFLRIEQRARYFNPKWIKGMKEEGYAGAREMMKFTEYQWGWDVTNPEIITEQMWNKTYKVYIQDEYNLDLKEFFEKENPYTYQSITARMLEVSRKGYWHPSEEVLEELAKKYAESVAEHGVTCCHHTCGNPLLREYIAGILSAPGVISTETAVKYNKEVQSAAGKGGVGEKEEVKVGKVMKEVEEEGEKGFPVSATPLVGVIAVIVILLVIYAGYKLGGGKR